MPSWVAFGVSHGQTTDPADGDETLVAFRLVDSPVFRSIGMQHLQRHADYFAQVGILPEGRKKCTEPMRRM